MVKPKAIKLRSFSVSNYDIQKKSSGLLKMLSETLSGTKAGDRRMPLNPDDPQNEQDFVSYYKVKGDNCIYGTIVRIGPSDSTPNIPDDLLDNELIEISDLEPIDNGTSNIYKNHYYFLLNDEFLITNLPGSTTIKRFEVYVNWYLEGVRGEQIFDIKPIIVPQPDLDLKDIKGITMGKQPIQTDTEPSTQSGYIRSRLSKAGDEIMKLFLDVDKLNQLKEAQIITAELLIKFSKPRKMKPKEYEDIMSSYLKPIADTDDVTITTKRGVKIKASQMFRVKDVQIEQTESKKISEPHLFLEMEKFLRDLTINEKSI